MRVLYRAVDNYTSLLKLSNVLLTSETIIQSLECMDRHLGSTDADDRISAQGLEVFGFTPSNVAIDIDDDEATVRTGSRIDMKKRRPSDTIVIDHSKATKPAKMASSSIDVCHDKRNMITSSTKSQSLYDAIMLTTRQQSDTNVTTISDQSHPAPKDVVARDSIVHDLDEHMGVQVVVPDILMNRWNDNVNDQPSQERQGDLQQIAEQQIIEQSQQQNTEGTRVGGEKDDEEKGAFQKKSRITNRVKSSAKTRKTVRFVVDEDDNILINIPTTSNTVASPYNIYDYRKDLFYSRRELRKIQSKVTVEVKFEIPDIMKELVQSWYKICSILPTADDDATKTKDDSTNSIDAGENDDMAEELRCVAYDWCDTEYRGYEPIILSLFLSRTNDSNDDSSNADRCEGIEILSKFAIPDQRQKLTESIIRFYKERRRYNKQLKKQKRDQIPTEEQLPERTIDEWNELLRNASVSVSKKSVQFAHQLALGDSMVVKSFYHDDESESETEILLLEDDLDEAVEYVE